MIRSFLIVSLLTFAYLVSKAQPGPVEKENYINTIAKDFNVTKQRAIIIYDALYFNRERIVKIMMDPNIPMNLKSKMIGPLEAENQAKIKATLTPEQLQILKNIHAKIRANPANSHIIKVNGKN